MTNLLLTLGGIAVLALLFWLAVKLADFMGDR